MKIAHSQQNVKVENVESKRFDIVFDRHMVHILSDLLYEDKILAIVRELSTNARDSQVEAGKNIPFDVHLPTTFDSTFYIRDYGTGMSPEKVDQVYRHYGKSDRSDSNDYTGYMGLGSKTPFCYNTKSCVVDSWCDGVHYQYACYLDEDGMPNVALLSKKDSNEPTGVKISLPTKSSDKWNFVDAAEKIYKFFDIQPNMVGENINVIFPKYNITGDNWKLDANDRRGGMKIVMGGVAYRVNSGALGDLSDLQKRVINNSFHVFVPIGEVSPTASREGLDYTNRTKTHIRHYINNIIKDFSLKIQEKISKCENLWKARLKFVECCQNTDVNLFDATKILYNNKQLLDITKVVDFEDMIKDGKIVINYFEYDSWKKCERTSLVHINPYKNPLLYENDLKVGSYVRSMAEAQKHNRNIILITFSDPCARIDFSDRIGTSNFTKISTIPSPNVNRGGSKRGRITKVVQFVKRSYGPKSCCWKNCEIDLKCGGVYVEFNRYNCRLFGNLIDPQSLTRLANKAEDAGINFPVIYGIKTANIKSVKNNSKWISYEDWLKNQVEEKLKDNQLHEIIANHDEVTKVCKYSYQQRRWSLYTIRELAYGFNCENDITRFVKSVDEIEERSKGWKNYTGLKSLCSHLNINFKCKKVKVVSLTKMEDDIYTKYPLLSSLTNVRDYEKVRDYINLVDGEKK